jgi:hypothetical protein
LSFCSCREQRITGVLQDLRRLLNVSCRGARTLTTTIARSLIAIFGSRRLGVIKGDDVVTFLFLGFDLLFLPVRKRKLTVSNS